MRPRLRRDGLTIAVAFAAVLAAQVQYGLTAGAVVAWWVGWAIVAVPLWRFGGRIGADVVARWRRKRARQRISAVGPAVTGVGVVLAVAIANVVSPGVALPILGALLIMGSALQAQVDTYASEIRANRDEVS